jgi:hypothetical protein
MMIPVSTALAALMAMPSASISQGRMDARSMAAQPLSDESLEVGTVSVLVRGDRVEGVEVTLVGAGGPQNEQSSEESLVSGRTNAEGRVFLKAAAYAGREVRVLVKPDGGSQRSVPFQIPTIGGVRLLFMAGRKDGPQEGQLQVPRPGIAAGASAAGGKAGTSGPSTTDVSVLRLRLNFRVHAIEGGTLHMSVAYSLTNRSEVAFDPGDHGLLLGVPEGNRSVTLANPSSPGMQAGKQGILVSMPVPAGDRGLQFVANVRLPADGPHVDVRLRSSLSISAFSVSLRAYPTVRIAGLGLLGPERIEATEEHGGTILLYRSSDEAGDRTVLSFQVTGIPVRTRMRSWPFALVALALFIAGIALALLRTGRSARGVEPASSGIVEALMDLERERLLGLVSEQEYEAKRRRLLTA